MFIYKSYSYLGVDNQVSLGIRENIRGKRDNKRDLQGYRIQVIHFLVKTKFTNLKRSNLLKREWQTMDMYGVGARHQNTIEEQTIIIIIQAARSATTYAAIYWPEPTLKTLLHLNMQ